MININRVFNSDRLMRSVTGLTIKGFEQLLLIFSQILLDLNLKNCSKQLKLGNRKRYY